MLLHGLFRLLNSVDSLAQNVKLSDDGTYTDTNSELSMFVVEPPAPKNRGIVLFQIRYLLELFILFNITLKITNIFQLLDLFYKLKIQKQVWKNGIIGRQADQMIWDSQKISLVLVSCRHHQTLIPVLQSKFLLMVSNLNLKL